MKTIPTRNKNPASTTGAQPPAPLPLFAWAARQDRATTAPRLELRHDLRDADGAPRVCIAMPGRHGPLAFASVTDALAALARMEVADAPR